MEDVYKRQAHIQLAEIGILQYRPEGVQALLQDLLSVCHKQQTAGPVSYTHLDVYKRQLLPPVVQCHALGQAGAAVRAEKQSGL